MQPEQTLRLPSVDEFSSWNEDQVIEHLTHDINFHVLTFESTFFTIFRPQPNLSHLQKRVERKSTSRYEHSQVERDGHGDETSCVLIGSRYENQE